MFCSPELSQTVLRSCVVCSLIDAVAASDSVLWPTVAVSWVFSSVTLIIFIACYYVVKTRRKKKPQNDQEAQPFRRELSVQSQVSNMTRDSSQSTVPLCNNTGYTRVPSREPHVNRRKSDFISKWCSEHNLSELIANCLRENGFTSREQIQSLRADDVNTLGLPNLAQTVQLRNVLETLEQQSDQTNSTGESVKDRVTDVRMIPGTRSRSLSPKSVSDESSVSSMSPTSLSPTNLYIPYNTTKYPPRLENVIEEPSPVRRGSGRLQFHGLLSDSGLYDIAESVGSEWRHLAALLGVTKTKQEHLLHDYPNNTKQQICEMLRYWREHLAEGEKEQVKADLAEAFRKIRRNDLSDKVLREQVNGSDDDLRAPYHMNSVV